jgi:hypothetical protein
MRENRSMQVPLSESRWSLAIFFTPMVLLLSLGLGCRDAKGSTVTYPATPFISPASGTYTTGRTVTISDATVGTTIYYTTDGSAPTVSSPIYSGLISIPTSPVTETIRAFAVKAGVYGSSTSTTYTIAPQMPGPTYSLAQGSYMSAENVSLLTSQQGGVIHYTIDGTSPLNSSPIYAGTPIHVAQRTTIEAFVAAIPGYSSSPITQQTYSIIPATPFITPAAGTYTTGQTVTLIDVTPGSTLYYTTDGTAPTTGSPRYTSPISIPTESIQETIRAFASLAGVYGSATSAAYTISPVVQVPAPIITPGGGSYSTNVAITLSDSMDGAKIYYTLDGTTPPGEAILYSGPFSFPPNQTETRVVKAIAILAGHPSSALSQSTFTVSLPSGVIASAVVGGATPIITIPTNFLGFSHEWGDAQTMMGQNSTGINPIYRQLVSTLSTAMGGTLVIRVGGGSTDTSGPATAGTVIPFAELAQAANVSFILGVNLGSNNVALAEEQAGIFTAGLPVSALSALEIGNEPDGYSSNGLRSSTYSYSDFLTQYQQWTQGISSLSSQSIPVSAPTLGGGVWMASAQSSVEDLTLKAAIITQHKYVACYYADNPLPTDILLQPSSSTTAMLSGLATYVAAAQQAHTPFRIAETNSICNGGQSGVSDTFQSALWAIDAMFEFAHIGVGGVNWNTSYDGGPYDLFHFNTPTNGTYYLLGVRPIYYGLLFFARNAGNSAELLPVTTLTNDNIKVWITKDSPGHAHIVIINKEQSVSGNVLVTLPGYSTGTTSSLSASSYLATTGITIGGQTYDGSTSGVLQGSMQSGTVYSSGGVWSVPISAMSAVSVDLQP